MLVLQGQGGQSATEPVPPADDVGTLRAGWGGWIVATYENDPSSGEPVALAMLDGEDPERGRLSIGCAGGINSVSVQWNEYLGNATSDLELEVSVDGEASEPIQWEITGDADATILRGDEAADFAVALYGRTGLDLRTLALDGERISLRFDITEIEEVVPLVREHCSW